MLNQDGTIVFTEEDKSNLVIRKYTDEELEEKRELFKVKRNRRRLVMVLIILALIVLPRAFVGIQYGCSIALAFMIFLFLVCELWDRTDIKAELRPYYFEIQVDKALPSETHADGDLTSGVSSFFPVEGRDTTSGYKSIFYIDYKQYMGAQAGEIFRISVCRETL